MCWEQLHRRKTSEPPIKIRNRGEIAGLGKIISDRANVMKDGRARSKKKEHSSLTERNWSQS